MSNIPVHDQSVAPRDALMAGAGSIGLAGAIAALASTARVISWADSMAAVPAAARMLYG